MMKEFERAMNLGFENADFSLVAEQQALDASETEISDFTLYQR